MRSLILKQTAIIILAFFALVSSVHAEAEFCWRDSYGRGVGSVPLTCGPGQELIGLLCYPKCGANMKRFGFDCHSTCPDGWRNDGLFCRKAEYGRGAGYPWHLDDGFSDDGMISRCERDNGRGGCEMWGAVAYPKCKPGYSPFGCCICRPPVPDCGSMNMNPGIDLSCAKKIQIGSPQAGSCAPGEVNDAGLCYPKCADGYSGVGPVCWGKVPPGWVECGMGAAKDSKTCGEIVFGQVESVVSAAGEITAAVLTAGGSAGATAGAKSAANASKLASLREKYKRLQVIYKQNEKQLKAVERARKGYDAHQAASNTGDLLEANADEVSEEDIARISAEIAALVDPTGVSGVVASYTYSVCSKKFPQTKPPVPPAPPQASLAATTASGQLQVRELFNSRDADLVWGEPDRKGLITNAVVGGVTAIRLASGAEVSQPMGICRVTMKETGDTKGEARGGSPSVGTYNFQTGTCETALPIAAIGSRTSFAIDDPTVNAARHAIHILAIRPGKDMGAVQWKEFSQVNDRRNSLCQASIGKEVRTGAAYENSRTDMGCKLTYRGKSLTLAEGGGIKLKVLFRELGY